MATSANESTKKMSFAAIAIALAKRCQQAHVARSSMREIRSLPRRDSEPVSILIDCFVVGLLAMTLFNGPHRSLTWQNAISIVTGLVG